MVVDVGRHVHHRAQYLVVRGRVLQRGDGQRRRIFRHSQQAGLFHVVFLSEIGGDIRRNQHPFAFPVVQAGFTVKDEQFVHIRVQNRSGFRHREAAQHHRQRHDQRQNLFHFGFLLYHFCGLFPLFDLIISHLCAKLQSFQTDFTIQTLSRLTPRSTLRTRSQSAAPRR